MVVISKKWIDTSGFVPDVTGLVAPITLQGNTETEIIALLFSQCAVEVNPPCNRSYAARKKRKRPTMQKHGRALRYLL